jgi:hypothetical protein
MVSRLFLTIGTDPDLLLAMQDPQTAAKQRAQGRRAKDFRRHELLLPPSLYDRLRAEAEDRCMPLNVLIRLRLEGTEAA